VSSSSKNPSPKRDGSLWNGRMGDKEGEEKEEMGLTD
jgi:hypothetical protein